MYRQFVEWVRDSILRERLADPSYGGDETYKIEVDKFGDPVKPHLNWNKPLPWRKPSEDQERALNSVYKTHPYDGTRMLDVKQMNFRYETFDYEKGGTPQISSRSPRTRAQHRRGSQPRRGGDDLERHGLRERQRRIVRETNQPSALVAL